MTKIFHVFLGQDNSKYESAFEPMGNDKYVAILTIKNLEEIDLKKAYYLTLNANGNTR